MKEHFISHDISLLEALERINSIAPDPLVLFVMDADNRMVGTLTDGDSRRALIAGASVTEKVEKIMHRNFNYMKVEDIDNVKEIKRQKEIKMKLVPVLDKDMHIVEIIDLEKYKTRLPIDAVLMAGGKGERLRPLTEKTPKPLLPVGGKAIIDHNIDRLIANGVKHINVTVNYLGEQLEEHFAEPHNGVQVQTVREPKFLGTIGSIKFVKRFYNDTVLVMNSDLFTNINYEDFYLFNDDFLAPSFTVLDLHKIEKTDSVYQNEEYGATYEFNYIDEDKVTYFNVFDFSEKGDILDKVVFESTCVGADYEVFFVPVGEDEKPVTDREALMLDDLFHLSHTPFH